jgi:Gpi18-like mannosyltransferase
MRAWIRSHGFALAVILIGILIAVALRLSLLEFKSSDYFAYTKVWYNTLKAEGFSAFGRGFANYNLPYLYLLYAVIRLFPNLPPEMAVKVPSLFADLVMAWLVFRIVSLRYGGSSIPVLAAFVTLFAPTVVLNSAFWGQADALYTCALLAFIYFLLRGRDGWAVVFFGLAFAFKAQAAILLPLLAGLCLRGVIRWRMLAWIPMVMVAALLPALIAGRPLIDLLLIYPSQVGQYEQLTMHAPSSMAWIPDGGRFYPYFYPVAVILTTAASLGFVWAVNRSSNKLTPGLLVQLALLCAVFVPFLLPKMHERYFYLADVLSIVVAFYYPALYWIPLAMIGASFFAYQPTLFGAEPVPIAALALVVLVLLVAIVRHTLPQLFPSRPGA